MSKASGRWRDVNAIYQIYPRSFKDSNDDGIGDLRGVIEKLDYLKDTLGVEALWFSPMYPSPMVDFGYDVSDYRTIDPMFGSLDDFKELLAEAHARGIKVMLDFVLNHTSDQHEWFQESREARDSLKRDFYVWRDPQPDGSPPNNWLSIFGGSIWEFDEKTGQYYMHTFLKEQPDLNWAHPKVREAMGDVLRFWLDMGVDGMRADAVRYISKDYEALNDDPVNPAYDPTTYRDPYASQIHLYNQYGPHLFTYLRELTDILMQYEHRMMIFEEYPDEIRGFKDQYLSFYGINPKVSAPFNFSVLGLPFSAASFQSMISEFQGFINTRHVPVYCFSNHDRPRIVSRYGEAEARVLAVLQLTLPGIPVLYYGDELGMEDGPIKPSEVRDTLEKVLPGIGQGRDPERTPMRWDTAVNAGFTNGTPWLPLGKKLGTINVETEADTDGSFLQMYHTLLMARKKHRALRTGKFDVFSEGVDDVMCYRRWNKDSEFYVLCNFSVEPRAVEIPQQAELLVSTHPKETVSYVTPTMVNLRPHEAVLMQAAVPGSVDDRPV